MTTLTLTYQSAKESVLRLTEYIGLKAGAFDKLRAIDEDRDQLRCWWREGLTIIGNVLDRLVARPMVYDNESDKAVLVINNTNDNSAQLPDAVYSVITLHIVVRWLKLVAPQLVEAYYVDFAHARDELARMAYFREMPR